jgi:hypothetical protein
LLPAEVSLRSSPAARTAAGAILGACAWPLVAPALSVLPLPVRFAAAWLVFTFGPGAAASGWLTRNLDDLRRLIVVLGVGSAATAVLGDVLGRAHIIGAYPYVAAALAGSALAAWPSKNGRANPERGDVIACVGLAALALGLGACVFWHRLQTPGGSIVLYGDYDTADLSYYAAEASEMSHTVPPLASYYSGHQLNAAYYPHLVLGMIHRFAGVPVLPMYYRYAWPTFLALNALTFFALARSVASRAVSALATVFMLAGSDFSYLAAWFLPHADYNWDYVLWPTNFLSPTMHVMHFATWGPTLPVFFTGLYAIVRGLQTRSAAWLVLSAGLIAVLFPFKPFCYIVLMGALAAATVFAPGDWPARRRYVSTILLGLLFSAPYLYGAATVDADDRRSRLLIDPFLLPKRMLIKIDLTNAFQAAAHRLAVWLPLETPIFLLLASVVFLAIGIGVRWAGAASVWRAIRQKADAVDAASWRLLAWVVVAGIGIPFVLATEPYVDTLQFYLTGLYVMWIFAAVGLIAFARSHAKIGGLTVALALAAALPSSIHYLARKWNDPDRPPRVVLTRGEVTIAEYLKRETDAEASVVLHDRPLSPSLMTIVSERRIVLGWDVRYSAVGGEDRLRDVNAFYSSAGADASPTYEILRRYHVTHVIVRPAANRVNAEVLAKLQPLLEFPDVSLYAVPPRADP